MSLLELTDISHFLPHQAISLLVEQSKNPLDLILIWKISAMTISVVTIGVSILQLLLIFTNSAVLSESDLIISAISYAVIMLWQIPYISLSFEDDKTAFANDKVAQVTIGLDAIGIIVKGVLSIFVKTAATTTNIYTTILETMSAIRSIGYFVVSWDYMQ